MPRASLNNGQVLLPVLYRQPCWSTAVQVHARLITSGLGRRLPIHSALCLWNAILRLYSLGPRPDEAFLLIADQSLPINNSFALSFLIKSCANLLQPITGRQLHAAAVTRGFHPGVYVQTALLNMYSDCGLISDACQVFDEMPTRNIVTLNAMMAGLALWGQLPRARALFDTMQDPNVVSWTCLIDGYTRAGHPNEAVTLFKQMVVAGVTPTVVTILAVAPAIDGLDLAASVHGVCTKRGLICMADVRVHNCLIDVYAKCGAMQSSLRVFDELFKRRRENLVTWTSVVAGLAANGMAMDAMEMMERMVKEGVTPNRVTILCVLSACSHGGMVEEGLNVFSSMERYGIEPEEKHYGCLVDMLGRAGRLEEAERVILGMPARMTATGAAANSVMWRILLNCCSMHGEVEMGERALRKVMEMEREHAHGADYVVMSNVLTWAGRLGDAEKVRKMMNQRKVAKIPGCSLV